MDILINFHNKLHIAHPRPHRMIVVLVFWSSFCLLSVKDMSKCKSILDYFKLNSESEILDGTENHIHDQSEPSVSGLPVTGVSCESQFVEDDTDFDRELGLHLNQHLNEPPHFTV